MNTGRRRDADAITIAGDYQARALESSWAAQRFWHAARIRLLDRLAPARADSRVADAGCGSGTFERVAEEGPFDQIYCLEVIEHVYREQALHALRVLAQAARPGAEIFVTTPNQRSVWPAIEWALDRLQFVPTLAEAQHLTCFTRDSLAGALANAGWSVSEIGTFNGVAPFAAGISERLARGIERWEFAGRRMLPMNLLYAIARLG